MNERIFELAEQAENYATTRHPVSNIALSVNNEKFVKKFAELMVEECMTTVLKESKWYWDKDEFESSNAIQNAARRVKEHFGVE